jgi:hypothetical protein
MELALLARTLHGVLDEDGDGDDEVLVVAWCSG